ncbi:hypothetical protein [Candidatus Endomicrobiellum trichonymphae]|nr:hypothetical protein [Candidatus Endomicrobium trichonymphae]
MIYIRTQMGGGGGGGGDTTPRELLSASLLMFNKTLSAFHET